MTQNLEHLRQWIGRSTRSWVEDDNGALALNAAAEFR